MSTTNRRKRVVRDGSAPKRRSVSVKVIDDGPDFLEFEQFCSGDGSMAMRGLVDLMPPRTLPKEVTEAADRLSLLRALRTAARTMLTSTAQDWVRMGLPESELAEVMEGLAQEFKAAARKKGVQG